MDDLRLALLVAFLNSRELHGITDCLADPDAYVRWAAEHAPDAANDDGVDGAALLAALAPYASTPTAADLATIRAARDALLRLLDGDAGGADRTLAPATGALTLEPRIDAARLHLVPASRGPAGVAALALAIAHEAMADGVWAWMSRCRSDECRWVFVDRSRNHSRVWCDMAACGNVAKARAYRRRLRTTR